MFMGFFGSLASGAQTKIISSEFLNAAPIGRSGPQLVEVDLEGTRKYILTFTAEGEESPIVTLEKRDFLDLQWDMRKIVTQGILARRKNKQVKHRVCDKELVYTKVDADKELSSETLCLSDFGPKNQRLVSLWLSEVKKRAN